MRKIQFTFLIALLTAFGPGAWAQGLTGQISGSVRDQSGSVIAGASVELTNTGTGQSRSVTTDAGGEFVFAQLLAGDYSLAVTASGFKKYEEKGIALSSSERVVVRPIALVLGAVSDSVTVSAEAARLQTQSAERAGSLDAQQITQIPQKGRHFLGLLNLMPGVINNNNFDAPSIGGAGSLRVNGSRAGQLTITTDGVPNADTGNQQGPPIVPSLESIGEIKVLLSNYQAEYGRNSGGSITTVTKAGTRDFHGGAYFFKRNEFFNANGFFNNRDRVARQRYRYDYPGYYVGGPILIPGLIKTREKLFFFWSQEYLPRNTPITPVRQTFPTALELSGDFSQTRDTNGAVIRINDPLNNKAQFPGNVIPGSRIDKAGQALLSVFPRPNTFDPSYTFNTIISGNISEPHSFEVLRVDWNVGSKTTFYARGLYNTATRTSKDWFNAFPVSNTFPLVTGTFKEPSKGAVATLIHTFTPTLINEFTLGVNRYTQQPFEPDQDSLARANRGALGIDFPQFFPQLNPYNVIPNATFGGVQNAPSIAWERRWVFFGTNTPWTLSDNLSWIKNRHNIKTGIYWEKTARNATANCGCTSFMGTANFGRDVNNPLDTNYAFSNALLGTLTSYTESDTRQDMHARYQNLEWFLQDNWRVTKRFTLDIGVRLYHIGSTSSAGNRLASFEPGEFDAARAAKLIQPYRAAPAAARQGINPATGEIVPSALIGTLAPGSGVFYQGMKVFDETIMFSKPVIVAPRFGFALDVFGNGKTALRGGFGIFPGRIGDDQTATHILQPPLLNNRTYSYTTIRDLASSRVSFSPASTLGVEHHPNAPTTYNMSFGIQQDIGFHTILDVAYVGSLSRHLQQQRSLNAIPYGSTFQAANADATTGAALPLDFLRPIVGYGDINYNELSSNSSYHSMQTQLNRRFSNGLTFGAAWTWSKAMDLVDSNQPINPFIDPRIWHYGKAGFDRTHTLVINYNYQLPGLTRYWRNAVVRTAFDSWEIAGVTSFLSGEPQGVSYSLVSTTDLTGGGGSGVSARPDLRGEVSIPKSDRTPLRAFNTDNVVLPADRFGRGNAPKDVFRGPGINNWDITLNKNFPFGKEAKRNLQFRFETFNTFNHTQFSAVDTVARFDAAGRQTNGRFGQYTGARDGRRVQLGLKFSF